MSTAQDLELIDLHIDDAKKKIARKDALKRLEQNQDYKDLIEKGFFESHAVRQVMLKAHPGMQNPDTQKILDQQIIAVGAFKQFIIAVHGEGMNAEAALIADEATREELLKEDLTYE